MRLTCRADATLDEPNSCDRGFVQSELEDQLCGRGQAADLTMKLKGVVTAYAALRLHHVPLWHQHKLVPSWNEGEISAWDPHLSAQSHFCNTFVISSESFGLFQTPMASQRSAALVRRLASCPAAWRSGPLITPLQRRGIHGRSEQRAPYEKAENVGDRRFSQFDVGGKVFIVTGSASRPPRF